MRLSLDKLANPMQSRFQLYCFRMQDHLKTLRTRRDSPLVRGGVVEFSCCGGRRDRDCGR